jgi:hypothetical protein
MEFAQVDKEMLGKAYDVFIMPYLASFTGKDKEREAFRELMKTAFFSGGGFVLALVSSTASVSQEEANAMLNAMHDALDGYIPLMGVMRGRGEG